MSVLVQDPEPPTEGLTLSSLADLAVKRSRAAISQALAPESPLVQKLLASKTVDIAPELTVRLHRVLQETLAPFLDTPSLQGVLDWSLPPFAVALHAKPPVEYQRATRLATIGEAFLNVSAVATAWPVNPSLIFDLLTQAALPHEFKGLTQDTKAVHSDLSRRHLAGALRNIELHAQRLATTAILEGFLHYEPERIA